MTAEPDPTSVTVPLAASRTVRPLLAVLQPMGRALARSASNARVVAVFRWSALPASEREQPTDQRERAEREADAAEVDALGHGDESADGEVADDGARE